MCHLSKSNEWRREQSGIDVSNCMTIGIVFRSTLQWTRKSLISPPERYHAKDECSGCAANYCDGNLLGIHCISHRVYRSDCTILRKL